MRIGAREFELRELAGHTASDLVLIDKTSGVLFAGGLVFHQRLPTTPHAEPKRWLASLDALSPLLTADRSVVPSDGPVHRGGLGTQGQRYSPLEGVNTGNVGELVLAWSFSFGGYKQRGQKSQPLIHNDEMYVTAPYSRIFALDANTGAKLRKCEHRLPDGIMPCCDVVNRGAALTGISGGEFDLVGRVEARDAKTGKAPCKCQTSSGVVAPPITWDDEATQCVAVVSGWGDAVPLWGGDVAKKVSFLEQGGSVRVFKLAK